MSQITCCPACATMFKVVAGQLQVARGWVRCGQCGAVFEALLHTVPGCANSTKDKAADAGRQGDQAIVAPEPAPVDAGVPAATHAESAGTGPGIDVQPALPALACDSNVRQEPVFSADELPAQPAGVEPALSEPADSTASGSQEFSELIFVREAQRRDFWTLRWVRGLVGTACVLLGLVLALQWAVRHKDMLAARNPKLVPWLQAMCRPLGCEVKPLRRIESLVIENSSFNRTGPDTYRLSFTFKNTGDVDVEIPALEITLTDTQDQAVVRRVVGSAEFGAATGTLAAYSTLASALTLKVAGDGGPALNPPAPASGLFSVTGYRILAFYP